MNNGITIESKSNGIRLVQMGNRILRGRFFVTEISKSFTSIVDNATSYSCEISKPGIYEVYCGHRLSNGKKVVFYIQVLGFNGSIEYKLISKAIAAKM